MTSTWGKWVRQVHRWASVALAAVVAAVVAALALGEQSASLVCLPLPPLAGLVLSGLSLFALPRAAKWRGRRRAHA